MSWKPTREDFLRMMKTNHRIFGDEILQMDDGASEDVLIKFFEVKLSKMLEYEIFANSKYSFTKCSKFGLDFVGLKKPGFGLNIKQCIDIFNFVYGRMYYDSIYKDYKLHWTDSVIVLNYIQDGYPLTEAAYIFLRNGKDFGPIHNYY